MSTIRSVTIQNFHKVDFDVVEFKEHANYLYGVNGAGKSTVLQAIQLCLLGYIPGENKTISNLYEHAHDKSIPIQIEVELINSEYMGGLIYVKRFVGKKNGKLVNEVELAPKQNTIEQIVSDNEMLVFDFNSFASLTANKQKEAIIPLLPKSEDKIRTSIVLHGLDSYCESASQYIEEVSAKYPIIDDPQVCEQVNSYLKQAQSSVNHTLKRLTSTVQSLIFYDDYDGTDDVNSIKSQIAELQSKLARVSATQAQVQSNNRIKSQLEGFRDLADRVENDIDYAKLKVYLEVASNKEDEIEKSIAEVSEKLIDLKHEVSDWDSLLQAGKICPLLKITCNQITDQYLKSNVDDKKTQIDELSDELESLNEEKSNNTDKKNSYLGQMRATEQRYKQRDLLESQIVKVDGEDDVAGESVKSQINMLTESLQKASANKQYQETMEKLQNEKFELEAQEAFLKEAVKKTGTNGLQSELARKPFDMIQSQMQSLISDMKLQALGMPKFIVESKANSFKFGFDRGNKFIPFAMLSSGEKCVFVLVLLSAIVSNSNTTVKSILIDDMFDHLDDTNFDLVTRYINQIDKIQFVVAGVKEIDKSKPVNIIEVKKR